MASLTTPARLHRVRICKEEIDALWVELKALVKKLRAVDIEKRVRYLF